LSIGSISANKILRGSKSKKRRVGRIVNVSKTAATLKQSRLDYWLISTHMIYDLAKVDIEPGFRSDHSLIKIKFESQKASDRGPSFWRFNSNLLKNSEYITYMNNRIL
jgi:hypothetical protein